MIGYKMGSLLAGGLHYGQDFFSGELQVWMKNWYHCQHGNTYC